MSIKNFLIKKMLKSKMKDLPDEQADKMIMMIEKNPELFQKIGAEVQEKMNQGKDQMAASMEVMQKYQEELKKIF